MKLQTFLESTKLHSRNVKNIARDAKKFRKQIDRDNEKKNKDEERNHKKQERLSKKLTKSNINTLLKDMKSSSKTKESLISLVEKIDKNDIKPET